MRLRVGIVALFILASLFASVGKGGNVYAAITDNRGGANACYGSSRSYFDNTCYLWDDQPNHGVGFVLPPYNYDPAQRALQPVWEQSSSDGMRTALIQLLQGYVNSGDGKKQTGSAFIIQTMLGRSGDQANANGGRTISAADLNDVISRLSTATFIKSNTYPGVPDTGGDRNGGTYDVDFTWSNAAPSGEYLYIQQGGQTKYVLDFGCANPVGGLAGLDKVNQWKTSASSLVGVNFTPPNVPGWPAGASPGQTLTWRHTIFASGGDAPSLGYAVNKSGFSGANPWGNGAPANNNMPVNTTTPIGNGSSYSIGWGANHPEYSTYTVKASDGGNTLCESLSWGPSDYTKAPGDPWAQSNNACVPVPFNYNLTPGISGPNGVTTVGASIPTVTPTIDNTLAGNASSTTDSPPAQWQLWRIEVPPGGAIPTTQQEDNLAPCAHYNNNGANKCFDKGSGMQAFPAGRTTLALLNGETVGVTMPTGTKICYTLSVNPYSQTSGNWRHSAPACVTVSKKPKIQVWGNDLRTRGSIVTGLTSVNNGGIDSVFGSWVEYGGYSVSSNTGFSSGSGLKSGATLAGSSDTWNRLTFANVDASGTSKFGNLMALPSLPPLADQFMSQTPTGTLAGNTTSVDLPSGIYKTGNITITAGTVGQEANGHGKTVVIISSGTVTIGSNITYSGPVAGNKFNSIDQLPQVIIIANNIAIQGNVTEVDAWLLTPKTGDGSTNTINTCSDVSLGTPLTSNDCNKRLQINGPVSTQHLYLRRTAGSDTVSAAGDPAEVFNLRPDVYMWAYGRSTQAGKVQTVYSVEMPPRF
jgi:hypothetical protein